MNDFTKQKIEDKAEEYYWHRYDEQDAFIEGAKWMWNNTKLFVNAAVSKERDDKTRHCIPCWHIR